jgi:hypothetical protein
MSRAIEAAARRVAVSHLERQRAYKIYKQHIKDAKDSKELENDPVFQQLRDEMNTARANHESAITSYDAVCANPPLNE